MENKSLNVWMAIASLFGFLSVIAGALGDHLLKLNHVSEYFQAYMIANRYLMWSALILLILGIYRERCDNVMILNNILLLFLAATVLFCGGIFFWVLTKVTLFKFCIPIGGALFMIAWLFFLITIILKKLN